MQQVWLLSNSEHLVAWIQVHNCAAAHWTASAAGACFPESLNDPAFFLRELPKASISKEGRDCFW